MVNTFTQMSRPILKTEDEIELIRQSSLLVSKALGMLKPYIQPGTSTRKLDTLAEEFIQDNGGIPAFKNYRSSKDQDPFPYTLCVSCDNAVVHGLPNDEPLKEGMIVSVDCGVLMNGYYGDSAYSFIVGDTTPEREQLLRVTYESLQKGIENAVSGNRIGDISYAVQSYVENYGYGVVRDLVGHGVGKKLHEPPEVPNFGKRGNGIKLEEGLVIAIEPMINMGHYGVQLAKDGWTILTKDGKPSAHFEHTVVVRKGRAELLTTFEYILN